MKIRKVKVGIKDVKTALNEFVDIGKAIETVDQGVIALKGFDEPVRLYEICY